MPAHCARDRLLEILAESAARLRAVPPAERQRFVSEHVLVWRQTLSAEYAGETVRITTERVPRESRAARNGRILAQLDAGVPPRQVAQRESVSTRLVEKLRQAAAAKNAA